MKRRFAIGASLLVVACGGEQEGQPVLRTEIGSGTIEPVAATIAKDSSCQQISFENATFTHCIADPGKNSVAMDLGPNTADSDSAPYRSLGNLPDTSNLAFAMNGGMFDGGGNPIGYYVEDGIRSKELSMSEGPGNFHLKPNGVFFGTSTKWQIRTADDFYNNVGDRPDFGTQSGPMLVINGKLHPKIAEDGPSKRIRNAVGIDSQGRAHFVMSQSAVSFGKLARFYRDELNTPNALYLDGTVSALLDPAGDRVDVGAPIGPIIVVENRK